ncbi:MAG TPA: cation transporter [Methylotenera sp.]|nr:cation transporter [Methylotenera sp.]HPV43920.1 cation transporter [Methylotenera sp.]
MKQERIYSISGLSCDHCAARVKASLAPYADAVEVSLKPPQIRLTGQTADVETLNAVLNNVGDYRIGAEV